MNQLILEAKLTSSKIGLILITTLLFIALFLVHTCVIKQYTWPILFGDRSKAIFDLWSFQHIGAGIVIGFVLTYLVYSKTFSNSSMSILIILFLFDLSWEIIELAMETGWLGPVIAQWKHGYEHWGNRLIGDPSMVILGGILAQKFKSIWKWVIIPMFLWLIINIFSPNSMTIQQLLFN